MAASQSQSAEVVVDEHLISQLFMGDHEQPALARSGDPDAESVVALWTGVLLRAIADWFLYYGSSNNTLQQWGADARDWLFDTENREIGSFIMICDLLGRDSEAARERLTSPPEELKHLIRNRRARRRIND